MTKRMKKITALLLSVVLVVAITATLMVGLTFADDPQPQEREFDANLDRMIDDCTGSNTEPAYLSVNWVAGQCDDHIAPIYKVGSEKISAGFESLSIELRSENQSIKLADLKIALRVADDETITGANSYALDDDAIVGAISLSEGSDIGSDWVTLTFDFTQSDIQVNGAAFDSTKDAALYGIHLYSADATKGGSLDIRKVYVTTAGADTVIQNFDGVKNIWWEGSDTGCAVNIPRQLVVESSQEIKSSVATSNNTDGAYNAIVLQIRGNVNPSLAPIDADGAVGTAVAWSELKDLEGTAVASVSNDFHNVVIGLDSLGKKEIQGVKVSVEGGKVCIAKAFLTNMESITPDSHFPVLDLDSVVYMSQFDFSYNPTNNYEQAVEDCAPFNCNYILSYTNSGSISDGHAIFDPVDGRVNIKIRSKASSEGRKYLVIKYRLGEGANLDNFRFAVINTDTDKNEEPVYSNQFYAGLGLPSLSDLNPYSDGIYSYLVIDLEKTFGDTYISGIDAHYEGSAPLYIDEIFYAHPVVKNTIKGDNILSEAMTINVADGNAYAYLGWLGNEAKAHDGIEIVMRGSEGYNLDKVRLELSGAGKTTWFAENPEGTFYDIYGRKMPALSTENQAYVIDFEKSGIGYSVIGDMHLHGEGVSGGATLTIESIRFIDYERNLVYTDEALPGDFAGKELTAQAIGYTYAGYMDSSVGQGYEQMIIEVEGDISKLRIQFPCGVRWIEANAEGSLKDASGNLFPTSGAQTLVIDLAKSGITELGETHFHIDFSAVGDVLKIKSVKFAKEKVETIVTDEVLPGDFAGKELTAQVADYTYAGYINSGAYQGYEQMIIEVEGDISQLRIEFPSGTRWIADNAQGSLKDANGNLFPTSGAQTLVIDLAQSGITELGDTHFHINFNAVGDVLKIKSVKFSKAKVGYEDIELPVNDDTNPVLSVSVVANATKGDEVVISASATDNHSENVTINYAVTLNGNAVEVVDGKFIASEVGTYSVKVTATDEAGNVSEFVQAVTVADAAPANSNEGLSAGAIVGIVIAAVAVVAIVVVVILFSKKKKEE